MSLSPNDVTAVIPTRGDCDLSQILDSLVFRNVLIWDNSRQEDLGAYGRYEAAARAFTDVVYTQDDDCVVDPEVQLQLLHEYEPGVLVSNMRSDHNAGMPLLALPGWGAIFDRELPNLALEAWHAHVLAGQYDDDFRRIGCDIVFPVLTESRMVDLGHTNLEHAEASDRTCKQPGYQEKKRTYYKRASVLRFALAVPL